MMRFEPLSEASIKLMAGRVREIDRIEFDAMSDGKSMIDCLQHLLDRSERPLAAFWGDELVAVYGVIRPTILSSTGCPWLCATSAIDRPEVRRSFVENTMPQMIEMSEGFSDLWNMVSISNRTAIRWLKWIGFSFDDEVLPINGVDFVKFKMEA